MENHVEIEPQDLPLLTCLIYINISVASTFSFIYLQFVYESGH